MKFTTKIVCLVFTLLLTGTSRAETVHIAIAANFTSAMKQIAQEFEKDTGHKTILSFASSGKIYAQIQHGAPFDVFLSADQTKPIALEKANLTVVKSRFTYAIGALALWSTKADLINNQLTVLHNNQFNKLSLANPKLAPYGTAAVETLTHLQLKQTTQHKWVLGENIAQAYQFVASGNADLGFVALSQIMDKGHIKGGSYYLVPDELYSPIKQDAVLLKSAQDNPAALALLDYLQSEKAQLIIKGYGYKTH
ncbi:molybdate ABC transporter substrate-binding protein [Catenovulum sp. 2E275]|uniref:molybdate ABC transporter substrate-binding protein n=1 Tax=Catenovulum sp. 2E275 TaxID=2980497 RepID=UPI0021D3CC79|nr:molybdate ABC transporter substrate-binding protein [Catenovulum sp. 2E275]MCU4677677.1 molybdate ABC transporter substrate-binding protein [Catenovulum sp. 2E275]